MGNIPQLTMQSEMVCLPEKYLAKIVDSICIQKESGQIFRGHFVFGVFGFDLSVFILKCYGSALESSAPLLSKLPTTRSPIVP